MDICLYCYNSSSTNAIVHNRPTLQEDAMDGLTMLTMVDLITFLHLVKTVMSWLWIQKLTQTLEARIHHNYNTSGMLMMSYGEALQDAAILRDTNVYADPAVVLYKKSHLHGPMERIRTNHPRAEAKAEFCTDDLQAPNDRSPTMLIPMHIEYHLTAIQELCPDGRHRLFCQMIGHLHCPDDFLDAIPALVKGCQQVIGITITKPNLIAKI